jgi:flagellar hook-associated protein 3 FlgL
MRITNSILNRDSLANVQANLRPIARAQSQVSTGLRIQKSSDDPAAAASVMRAAGSLRALEQYRRNTGAATGRAAAEEGVLQQLGDVLSRAKELGISQNSSTADPLSNDATRAEIETLLDFAVSLANTRHGDEFLFGGDTSGVAPIADPANPLAQPLPTGARRAEVGAGRYVTANHDASEVFGASGALAALSELRTALQTHDRGAMSTSLDSLDAAFGSVQSLLGETGARANQLQVTTANLDSLDVTLRTFKSDLEEVDLEQAITELVTKQTAYQAAMLATSKVLSLNLSDYLR